jgi:ABC-type lipoprotein release transport system permease subunit
MLVVGSFAVAPAIAMASAYLPARRAARLPVVKALQYEEKAPTPVAIRRLR